MAAAIPWHRDIKTWTQRNEFLFNNEIMSDCSFLVIEGTKKTTIPAHKYILGGNSPEFYNLFYLMQTSNEIPIEDTSAEILTTFLEFLYTEKTTLTIETVGDLLKLSKRFSVSHFEEFCGKFLTKSITKENALDVLDKYADYEMPNLVSKCIKLISCNQFIFETPSFLKISIQTLTELLKSNELQGFKEITVFNGVNKWSENYCQENNQIINSENKRWAIRPAIEFIRFAAMPLKDFTLCTLNNPILNPAECLEIYQCIGSGGESECKFSKKRRQIKKLKIFVITKSPIAQIHLKLKSSPLLCSLEFSVNKPISIHGFGILGRTTETLDLQNPEYLKIQLKGSQNNVLLETKLTIHYDGTEKTYELFFNESMLLKPNEFYTIMFKIMNLNLFKYHCCIDDNNDCGNNSGETLFNIRSDVNYFFKTIIFSKE